jgi:hypothetical protein
MTAAFHCRNCDARIIRYQASDGTWQALDYVPDPQGTMAASCDRGGIWHARELGPAKRLTPAEKVYAVHECQAVLPGVASLDDYRTTISTVTPAKRRRGKKATQ